MTKKKFLIVYEIHEQKEKKFPEIAAEISRWRCLSVHPLESVWLLQTSLNPDDMFANLKKKALAQDDYVLITEISDNYFGYLHGESWDIINQHIF